MRNRETTEKLQVLADRVMKVTGIDILNDKRRLRDIVYAKKIFYYCARKKLITFQQIADFMGANHATVIYHNTDTPYLLKQDSEFFSNYLRVQGRPQGISNSRMYFDLTIGNL